MRVKNNERVCLYVGVKSCALRALLKSVVAGSQSDLPKEGIVTTPDKLTEWTKQHGFLGWFETSAKENTGIEEAANFLVTKASESELSAMVGCALRSMCAVLITSERAVFSI